MEFESSVDLRPRTDLVPLIDVVFLLLTFFIYAMTTMVRADLLPVELTPVQQGQAANTPPMIAITIDHEGNLFLDRQPVALDDLRTTLEAIIPEDQRANVFVALEEAPNQSTADTIDRAPILLRTIEQLRAAGMDEVAVVGAPGN
ncbi:ExbD/TolR family protein [Mucisphaera sp.]|uniref:ExbD/TolR family protein n=1 Tax=Mucisphaera sp. TaxID=2913024 RepID=UPI003D0CB66B